MHFKITHADTHSQVWVTAQECPEKERAGMWKTESTERRAFRTLNFELSVLNAETAVRPL